PRRTQFHPLSLHDALPIFFPLGMQADDALMASLLTLSDVMGTGHHAAIIARVTPGKSVAVVGDGAVGLCGVIAAKRLGAEQIIRSEEHTSELQSLAYLVCR